MSNPPPPPPPPEGAALTVNAAEAFADDPAELAQVNVYVSVPVAVGDRVFVPLFASAPLQLPEAVHPVALTDDHVMVVELPLVMDEDASVKLGAAGTTCGRAANAAPACTNPLPEFTLGVGPPMARAVDLRAS
jgi:hypothetical protein